MANWPGVARCTVRFTRTLGDDMINVIHVRRDDLNPMGAVHLLEACTAIRDGWWDIAASSNDVRAFTANEVTLADIIAVSMDITNAGIFQQLVVNQQGNATGTLMAPQLAAVVSHRTAVAARSGRGRTYHGGLTGDHVTTNSAAYPVLTATTAFQGAWNGLDAALAALVNPQSHVIASEADEVARDVVNRVYTTKVFTQRRRN